MPITVEQIAAVTGARLPNIVQAWPLILASLTAHDMPTTPVQIAAVATVAVECPTWIPQAEKCNGTPEVYFQRYDGRLGNTEPGDGMRYRGRGYIQITGKANYERYGSMLDIDLVGSPDLALQPSMAADILALYFRDRGVDVAAIAGNWKQVRRLVNGGMNGINHFLDIVRALEAN